MTKFYTILVVLFTITISSTVPAHAQDGEALMRGLFGAVMKGMEEEKRNTRQQKQQTHQQQQDIYNPTQDVRRQNRQIQSALKQLNFYDGAIDGILGAGAVSAIKAYEKDFEHPVDGILDEDELNMLFKVAHAGFTSHEEAMTAVGAGFLTKKEYDEATAGGFVSKVEFSRAKDGGFKNKQDFDDASIKGFSTSADYTAFKKSGFNDSSEFVRAKNAGFQNKAEYETAEENGFATRNAFVTFQINTTKNLISDLEEFLPAYDGDVDILKISKLIKQLKPVRKNQWLNDLQRPVEELQAYAMSLTGFKDLQDKNYTARLIAMEQRKSILLSDIEDIRKFSDQFLRKNLMDDRATGLAEGMDNQPKANSKMSEGELQDIYNAMQGMIDSNRLSGEYRSSKASVPASNVIASGAASPSGNIQSNTASGLPRVQTPVETKKFRIVIDSVQKRQAVGDGTFMNERASAGSFYLIVNYTITNISKKSISTWGQPSFYLRDAEDNKYTFDFGATSAYSTESNQSEKSLSNLNPGITVNGAKAYQVSEQHFDPNSWVIEVNADKDFRVALY